MSNRRTYKKHKVVYVDVDNTLLVGGKANVELIEKLSRMKDEGFELVLWSARGGDHARMAAELTGTSLLFSAILSKPGYIIDDKGWTWARYVDNLFGV